MTTVNWPVVLEVKGKPVNAEIIEKQYRLLARQRHPDAGGSNEAMTELNLAKESALKWVSDQILAARQAEAAKEAARQAEAVFQQAFRQQMNTSANYQQQWANQAGYAQGLGNWASVAGIYANAMANAAAADAVAQVIHEAKKEKEKPKTKWQRVRDFIRGER